MLDPIRHRRTRPSGATPFDEKLWPLFVTLTLLALVVTGIIINLFRFDDPRTWRNPVTWLIILPVVTGLIMWATAHIQHGGVRRTLVLSVVLSLLINLSGLVVSSKVEIFTPNLADIQEKVSAQPSELITIPEYVDWKLETLDRRRRALVKPIETGNLDSVVDVPARQPTQSTTPESDTMPDVIDETVNRFQPALIERRQLVESASQGFSQTATLSRQPDTTPGLDVDEVEVPNAPVLAQTRLAAKSTEIQQLPQKHVPVQRPANEEPQHITSSSPSSSRKAELVRMPTISSSFDTTTMRRRLNAQLLNMASDEVTSPDISAFDAQPVDMAGPSSSSLSKSITRFAESRHDTNLVGVPSRMPQRPVSPTDLTRRPLPDPLLDQQSDEQVSNRANLRRTRAGLSVPTSSIHAEELEGPYIGLPTLPELTSRSDALFPQLNVPSSTSRPPRLGADSLPIPSSASNDRVEIPSQRRRRLLISRAVGPGGTGGSGGASLPMTARSDQQSTLETDRYLQRKVGGPLRTDTTAAIPTYAFQRRAVRKGESLAGGTGKPSMQTEEAIERGLVFLSDVQSPDGNWSLSLTRHRLDRQEGARLQSDTAATGLSLLAFLGAGYHHLDGQYQKVISDALSYLIRRQRPNGDLYIPFDANSNQSAWLYSHGIASIALCEAFGMTQDSSLREPAQNAVNFIVLAQHPVRGAWRYSPALGSDTSVSGWMLMALKSAELAGLNVPELTYQRTTYWLDVSQGSPIQNHLYRYNPFAPDTASQRHGREPTATMTSVGLLMRLYLGWHRDESAMQKGAGYLLNNLPEVGTNTKPKRDTYYWYYATQVMFHMGGEYWEQWNQRLRPLLVDTQVKNGPLAGSWDPQRPVPDRWASQAGRLYVTTMNLLSLEVYYRHLPIYEEMK